MYDEANAKWINKTIPSGTDKFVAADAADTTPGVLFDKVEAGSNMSFSMSADGKRIIFNASQPSLSGYMQESKYDPDGDGKVLDSLHADEADTASSANLADAAWDIIDGVDNTTGLKIAVVSALPGSPAANTIYFITS
jgi:hypothetical protein